MSRFLLQALAVALIAAGPVLVSGPILAEPVTKPSEPAAVRASKGRDAANSPAPQGEGAEGSQLTIGPDSVKPGKSEYKPYLAEEKLPDSLAILPPPPPHHSAAETADRIAFNVTRAYEGSSRWELATADVAEGGVALLDNFACVLGQRLDARNVPALMTLLDRARLDIARSNRAPKRHYRRLRPFVGNDAPICVARDQSLADSFSYPSGHSAQGWGYALIMATLLPEKATQLLVRGRLYGESRVICGVHWLSDVDAARLNASAVFAVLLTDPAFRADLEKARTELNRVLGSDGTKPDTASCAREESAARQSLLWDRPQNSNLILRKP